MTADYKTHGQRPQKKPLPGFVWLLIGLAIGLFVALIIYLDKQPENKISFGEAIERDLAKLKQKSGASTTSSNAAQEPVKPRSEPRFTYHGFRYVEVTGLPTKPTVESLMGQVVHTSLTKLDHSNVPTTCSIKSSR